MATKAKHSAKKAPVKNISAKAPAPKKKEVLMKKAAPKPAPAKAAAPAKGQPSKAQPGKGLKGAMQTLAKATSTTLKKVFEDKKAAGKKAAAPVVEAAPKAPAKAAAPKSKRAQALAQANLSQVAASLRTGKSGAPTMPVSDDVCREVACEGLATTSGYCRLHYIKNWKKIKRKELILKEGKLNQYIEELVAKYPDKYLEAIRQDLASEKEFSKVIHDLELDESAEEFDFENEADESLIDTIKRDFEDEGESF